MVPCPVLTVASWSVYRFLKRQVRWSGIPISFRIVHSLLWSTQSFKKWSEVAQLCPTLCDSMDYSLPGSSNHGIFQARILEWVSISFSKRSSLPRDWTWVSHIIGRRLTIWATREVHWQVGINPWQGFCHRLYEVTMEPQSKASHLLHTGRAIHWHKHTVDLVKYSRKHVH